MSNGLEVTGNRFRFVGGLKYTRRQRLRIWWRGVWCAIVEAPPKEYLKTELVRPGEPGYDEAPLAEVIQWLNFKDADEQT